MGILQLLPWCSIDRDYDLGEIRLLRVTRRSVITGLAPDEDQLVKRFLASYRSLDGDPVDPCAIVGFGSGNPGRDLSDAELSECAETLQILTFCSLAARRFFRQPYSNTACFIRYVQKFQDDRGIAIHSRRRDGGTLDGRILPQTVFGIPPQAAAVHELAIDETLFGSLMSFRDHVNASEWTRWQNAIDCFNFANTDDSSIPIHVEWVMTAAAFQRLLSARSDADAVASAFEPLLQPETSMLAGSATHRSFGPNSASRSLRAVWAREFYELRGEYAHGRLTTNRQHAWEAFEHLLIAAIAFPLVAKALLAQASLYTLTSEDYAQIDAFEPLLDSNFLRPPLDQQNSWDSVWSRLQSRVHGNRHLRDIVNEAFRKARGENAG
jgi:hypothetical protein